MREISPRNLLAGVLLACCWLVGISVGIAQDQASKAQGKKQLGHAQIEQQYLAAIPGQASLKLTADTETAQPNASIHFSLAWDRPVYRFAYIFDWGDRTPTEQRNTLEADHTFNAPGQYTVRVTAYSLANSKLAKGTGTVSNSVTVQILSSEASTSTLLADNPNLHVGELVRFTAAEQPSATDAQYIYDFGDGAPTPPQSDSNHAEHIYSATGVYHAFVTVLTNDEQQRVISPPVEIRVTALVPPPPILTVSIATKGKLTTDHPVEVTAVLRSKQRAARFDFDWSDGTPLENVDQRGLGVHSYTKAGKYEVVVIARTQQAYDPPVQGAVLLTIVDPAPVWKTIAAIVAAFCLGVVIWRASQRFLRPKTFRYVAHPGGSVHKLEFATKSAAERNSSGPFSLKSGLDREEHSLVLRE